MTALLVALLAVPPSQASQKALPVGKPAPALRVTRWLAGQPVRGFTPGQTYVVELWCGRYGDGPQFEATDETVQLAKKNIGKLTFVGVHLWGYQRAAIGAAGEVGGPIIGRGNGRISANATTRITDLAEQLGYRSADDGAGSTEKIWQRGNENMQIVVVGPDSRIAFAGSKGEWNEWLDQLGDIIDGGAAERPTPAEELTSYRDMYRRMKKNGGVKRENFLGWCAQVAKTLTTDPRFRKTRSGPMFYFQKPEFGAFADDMPGLEVARSLANNEWKDHASWLNSLADVILSRDELKLPKDAPAFALAVELANKANDLAKGQDPRFLATLAQAQFRYGDPAKAVESQQRFIELAKKVPAPKLWMKEFEAQLAEYKRAVKP